MGTTGSKPKEPPESKQKTKSKDLNEIIIFSNGDKFEGQIRNNEICGTGTYFYRNNDVYKGEWKNNKKHGHGTHHYVSQGKRYEGEWQNGFYHGPGEIFYSDKSSFKGTFFEGEKHGIGHFQDSKGRVFEERWVYGALKGRTQLSTVSGEESGQIETNKGEASEEDEPPIPKRSESVNNNREIKDADRRIIIYNERGRVNHNDEDTNDDEEKNDSENERESGSKPHRKMFETEVPQTLLVSNNGSQNDSQEDSPKDTPQNGRSKRRLSSGSIDGKENQFATERNEGELDSMKSEIGVDTLNMLEHMEALNSVGNYLLSKRIDNWTVSDVEDWLKHLGLGEYAEQFKANHITGANLLDLTDAELKQEFKITSLGHRKDIRKSIDQLKQIYRCGKDIEYLKEKIGAYYNKNLRFKRKNSINSYNSNEGALANLKKLYSGLYNSNQVIHEDQESDFLSKSRSESDTRRRKGSRSSERKRSQENEEMDGDEEPSPRNKQNCKPLFASDASGNSSPVESKKKKKRSAEASSGKGSIDQDYLHNSKDNGLGEGIARLPSPLKKEDAEPKGHIGSYLLHNQYDSHEHRENLKKHNSGQTPSYEESSSADTELSSSSDEDEEHSSKEMKSSRPGVPLNINQVLLGATGLGQVLHPVPHVEAREKKDSHGNTSEVSKRAHHETRHKHAPPAQHYEVNDDDDGVVENSRPQLRQDEQMRRFDDKDHSHRKHMNQDSRSKIQKSKNKSTRSVKEKLHNVREEILKIFKQTGLNENFIINYDELTIKGKIGEGGYGQVYEGIFSGTQVAIKEYGKRKLLGKAAEDFVKEVEVISSLRHPNVILYMGACIHEKKYLMITEYLEKGSLFDHLHKEHSKIPEEYVLSVCEDIALGMTYLHSRKVFHCDLKSSNILIDSNWLVKLCDFGLSRNKIKYNKKKSTKSQRVGTPHWMAPEILRGEDYDEKSDVYSYGMVLWEIITGEIPYFNMNVNEIVLRVGWEGKQVEIPTRGNPLIIQIMKMCLNGEREKRPTFKEIVDKLQPKISNNKKVKPSSKVIKK